MLRTRRSFLAGVAAGRRFKDRRQLTSSSARTRGKRGPVSQLDAKIEKVKKLPRKEQEFVLKFLDTVLDRAEKAS